jgi:hypothetical protein
MFFCLFCLSLCLHDCLSLSLNIYMSVFLSFCLSTCLSFCLSVYLHVCLSLSTCLSLYLHVCLSTFLSCLSLSSSRLSFYLFICVSFCLSACLSFDLVFVFLPPPYDGSLKFPLCGWQSNSRCKKLTKQDIFSHHGCATSRRSFNYIKKLPNAIPRSGAQVSHPE